VIDDTGYRQIRVKMVAPSLGKSAALLDRLFGSPNRPTSLIEAGVVEDRPYFEVSLFGAASQVEEVRARVSQRFGKAWEVEKK